MCECGSRVCEAVKKAEKILLTNIKKKKNGIRKCVHINMSSILAT